MQRTTSKHKDIVNNISDISIGFFFINIDFKSFWSLGRRVRLLFKNDHANSLILT